MAYQRPDHIKARQSKKDAQAYYKQRKSEDSSLTKDAIAEEIELKQLCVKELDDDGEPKSYSFDTIRKWLSTPPWKKV
jgi:putative IMPACT (imprinted ancient) family translation regulator